jgi:hypothetical protein
MGHSEFEPAAKERRPWNAGRMVGAKRALKPQQVWAIRFWLDRERRLRDRAMFDLAVDSKLRGCDIVKVGIGDLVSGGQVRSRAIVVQQKTGRPVQFELLEPARGSILAWLERRGGAAEDFVFPSRIDHADHISTRQYARLVDELPDRHPAVESSSSGALWSIVTMRRITPGRRDPLHRPNCGRSCSDESLLGSEASAISRIRVL